jgi:integrase
VAEPKLRPRGFRRCTIVGQYLVLRLGHVQLAEITPQHVQSFQNELLASPLARGTETVSSGIVLNARRALGRAMAQAAHWGLIARNPVRLVDGPHVTRKDIQPLDPDQARQLLTGDPRRSPRGALYTVALALGLRRGVALGLKSDDVDFAT